MKVIKTILIILLVVASIYAIGKRFNELTSISYIEEEYTIKNGDTLWSIAEQNANEHQDLREYIFKLKKVNNIDSTSNLEVGQTIIIFK